MAYEDSTYYPADASSGSSGTPQAVNTDNTGDSKYHLADELPIYDFRNDDGTRGIFLNLLNGNGIDTHGNKIDHFAEGLVGAPADLRLTEQSDYVIGGIRENYLWGFGGDDILLDVGGDDVLIGGRGADRMDSGPGYDRYVFESGDSTPQQTDRISDFTPGSDKIDLRAADANSLQEGRQAFQWIDPAHLSADFTGVAGQLRFSHGDLLGDTDGDKVADFQVHLRIFVNEYMPSLTKHFAASDVLL